MMVESQGENANKAETGSFQEPALAAAGNYVLCA